MKTLVDNQTTVNFKFDMNILYSHGCLDVIREPVYLILFRFEREIRIKYWKQNYKVKQYHTLDPWENSVIFSVNDLQGAKIYLSRILSEFPLYTVKHEQVIDPVFRALDSTFARQLQCLNCLVKPLLMEVKIITRVGCKESDVPEILSDIHSFKKSPRKLKTSEIQLMVMEFGSQVIIPDEQCIICFEEIGGMEQPSGALRLPCFHTFHSQCIFNWLDSNLSCPICRFPLITPAN